MKAKSNGYIIFDVTWNRLVRWVPYDGPSLWVADFGSARRGPTLFKTKAGARKAIAATRRMKPYAWAKNTYIIFEVHRED